jgi:hypothetical protein
MKKRFLIAAVLVVAVIPLVAAGQRFGRRAPRYTASVDYNSHFAFTRIRYNGAGGWEHDFPMADKNFSAIIDYISNVRVHLDGTNILDLDDAHLFENPIIYMSEPGYWRTSDTEAKSLAAHLLKGGFIIFDDFEGEAQWQNLVTQMRRVLPDHYFIPLTVESQIFHSFFDIKTLQSPHPMFPDIKPGFFGIFEKNDPSKRLMAIADYNNDIGDYWEWSAEGLYGEAGTNDAYRVGVNYIVYAMTH